MDGNLIPQLNLRITTVQIWEPNPHTMTTAISGIIFLFIFLQGKEVETCYPSFFTVYGWDSMHTWRLLGHILNQFKMSNQLKCIVKFTTCYNVSNRWTHKWSTLEEHSWIYELVEFCGFFFWSTRSTTRFNFVELFKKFIQIPYVSFTYITLVYWESSSFDLNRAMKMLITIVN